MSSRRIGLYPGTFDPVTLGHLDIIKRALKIVDHLIIGVVAINSAKSQYFSADERVEMMRHDATPLTDGKTTIEVKTYDTLQVKFAQTIGATVVIRGLRAVSDFEYEFQMAAMNQRMSPEIEQVFLMADPRNQAINSRLVKEIAMLGGDVTPFTTPYVANLLGKRCKELARR